MRNFTAMFLGGVSWLPLFEGENGGGSGGNTPPNNGGGGGGNGGGGEGGRQQPETFSREYVHELREENKSWRERHQAAEAARTAAEAARTAAEAAAAKAKEDAAKEADDAKKAAEATAAAAKKAADDRVIMAELRTAALKAGMVDLDGLKLADLSKVTLKEDGTVDGADALMTDLKKSKAYLFGEVRRGTGNPEQPPKPGDPPKFDAKTATKEELAAEKKRLGLNTR